MTIEAKGQALPDDSTVVIPSETTFAVLFQSESEDERNTPKRHPLNCHAEKAK